MAKIDPVMLSGWFDAYAPRLVLYARQWLAPAEAEDVVQEVFLRLFGQKAEPDSVKAWLFTAVRNASISGLRSHLRRKRRERDRGANQREWFLPNADDLIDAKSAQAALADIDPAVREIVVLRIWGQMTLRQISEITDTSPATALRRYRDGLAAIRKRLESSCQAHTD
jgi:RNA polymerase sigma factor (sigma-70 family)